MKQAVAGNASQSFAEVLVIGFLGAITLFAHASGMTLILFPELAALSHDIITRPRGRWASEPRQLILTPTLTAILGLFLTRHLSYGALQMALIVGLSLIVIRITRSTIAPAISAGLLPMVLAERSWLYPVAIFLGIGILVVVLKLWQRFGPRDVRPGIRAAEHSRLVDALEAVPHSRLWALGLMTFVLGLGALAQASGLRFLVFPPLIVIAYELFGHPEVPGWMKRPALLPVVCLLTASVGLIAHQAIHAEFLAVMITMLGSVLILRVFRVHMPPALAVGLLPFVMDSPDGRFPISVLLGTSALTLYFFGYRRLLHAMEASAPKRSSSKSSTPSSCSSPSL